MDYTALPQLFLYRGRETFSALKRNGRRKHHHIDFTLQFHESIIGGSMAFKSTSENKSDTN